MTSPPGVGRRIPVGRVVMVLALAVAIWAMARGASAPRWRPLGPGLEFATLRGDPYCRRGSSEIALLRLDPQRVLVRVYHCSRQPEQTPLAMLEWQRRLQAIAVFNAGQYYPDFSYMGLLVSGGDVVSNHPHPDFQAALVASPLRGRPQVHVLDLDQTPLGGAALPWREVAQSFMLFDKGGKLRVRKSEQVANRTAVAEDQRGRIVVATTEGGYTLWEFGRLLAKAPLGLSHAMSMDGGREAELCVRTEAFRYASFARWEAAERGEGGVPLPAVVAVSLR
jgi:phosphodiester glycosidase